MAALLSYNKDILKGIGNRFNKDLITFHREQRSKSNLSNLLPFYFPHSHYTIRYNDLELIVNQFFYSRTNAILELGSGLSTLCFGVLAKKISDIKIHSLEHDENWYELMRRFIEMNNLDNIQLDFVPLKEFKIDSFYGRFFDLEKVKLKSYDAIIIDGPPANKKEIMYSRYPSINILKKHLAKGGFFYLDDIHRKGEQKCIEKWQNDIYIKMGIRHEYGNGQIFFLEGLK